MKLCHFFRIRLRPGHGAELSTTLSQKICRLACYWIGLCLVLVGSGVRAEVPLDVRLVIDISGSMAAADPNNRRADALSMFIRMLPETAFAGVWTFGGQVNELVRHDRVGPLWKNIALTRTANLPVHALRSNLPQALERASWDWDKPAANGPRHILLLTDGAVDISDSSAVNQAATTSLLGDLAPRLAQADIRLHVLAMKDAPGAQLLGQLAAATGGVALEGITPNDLLSQFMEAIDAVALASEVPLDRPLARVEPASLAEPNLPAGVRTLAKAPAAVRLAAPEDRVFRVDAGIGSVDLLWLADPQVQLQITDPKGNKFGRAQLPQRSRWHVGRGFELVTIAAPAPGLWRLAERPGLSAPSAQAPSARMLAYADVQLQLLDSRGALAAQALQSVDAQISNGQGQAITDLDFLAQVDVQAYLDTSKGSRVVVVEPGVADGQYRATLPALADLEEGVLRFEAVGATFSRGVRMPFQVRSPIQLELIPQGRGALGWVKIGVDGLEPSSLAILAKVQKPPAPGSWVAALEQPGGLWKLVLDEPAGALEIELDVQGKYLSGKDFSFRSERLELVFPLQKNQSFKLDESGRKIQAPMVPTVAEVVELPANEPQALPETPAAVVAPQIEAATAAASETAQELQAEAAQPAPEPAGPMLPLWFVGLVSLMNLGICAGLGWLLRPSQASRELISQLSGELTEEPAAA